MGSVIESNWDERTRMNGKMEYDQLGVDVLISYVSVVWSVGDCLCNIVFATLSHNPARSHSSVSARRVCDLSQESDELRIVTKSGLYLHRSTNITT